MRSLLFLTCFNDLDRASACINPRTFADDTNLFDPSKNVKTLETRNFELINIFERLKTNKPSRNIGITNFILFYPSNANKNLPLKTPVLSLEGIGNK